MQKQQTSSMFPFLSQKVDFTKTAAVEGNPLKLSGSFFFTNTVVFAAFS